MAASRSEELARLQDIVDIELTPLLNVATLARSQWDTAGQERFRTITTAYYRGAMGILLVFDVTDERSFANIRTWHSNVEQHASEGVSRLLVGNKSDWTEKRAVSQEEAQKLADELGIRYVETSAKNNDQVDDAFVGLAREVKQKLVESGAINPVMGTATNQGQGAGNVNVSQGGAAGAKQGGCC